MEEYAVETDKKGQERCKISISANPPLFDYLWSWWRVSVPVIWESTKTFSLTVLDSTVLSLLPLCPQTFHKLVLSAKEHKYYLMATTRRYICADCSLSTLRNGKQLLSLFGNQNKKIGLPRLYELSHFTGLVCILDILSPSAFKSWKNVL